MTLLLIATLMSLGLCVAALAVHTQDGA